MSRPLQVVELATNDTLGGAARSAYRLHVGLRELGVEARMLARWKHSDDPTVQAYEPNHIDQERIAVDRPTRQRWVTDNRTDRTDTLFSLGQLSLDVTHHPLVRSADVIHLHWVANFLGPASFDALVALDRPIVWTLHDEWAYTGGCHYAAGCDGYRHGCARCPQLFEDPLRLVERLFAERLAAWQGAPLTVVTPSRWLASCAGSSAILRGHDVRVIPYGLDTSVFTPPSAEARRIFRVRHGIPRERFVLAFGVDRLAERRKGHEHLVEALAIARERLGDVHLLRFGDPTGAPTIDLPTTDLGRIDDDDALALAYGSADAFVLPTLEDNLPNGVLESLASGTPVLGYATGGVPDLVEEGITGWLAPTGDVQALAAKLVEATADIEAARRMGVNGRIAALQRHTLRAQAGSYRALYEELLGGAASWEAVA